MPQYSTTSKIGLSLFLTMKNSKTLMFKCLVIRIPSYPRINRFLHYFLFDTVSALKLYMLQVVLFSLPLGNIISFIFSLAELVDSVIAIKFLVTVVKKSLKTSTIKSIFTSNNSFFLSQTFYFLLLPTKFCCTVILSMNMETSCHVVLNTWAAFGDPQFVLLNLDYPVCDFGSAAFYATLLA